MTQVMFGPYEPDVASVGTKSTAFVQNVTPRKDGWGPMASPVQLGSALPSDCCGGFDALDAFGRKYAFAGTAGGLFLLDPTTLVWSDVSGGVYSVYAGELWSFVQFGSLVIATTAGQIPLSFDLDTSDAFAPLGGSPPRARGAAIVGDFVVLHGLTDFPSRIQWCGLNDATWWTPGQRNSDFQDFPDGGSVRGVAGGEYGLVFQDTAVRRMIFQAGSDEVFDFSRISGDRGLLSPYALTQSGQEIFFLGQDGFSRTDQSGALVNIGQGRVDTTFFGDVDLSQPRNVVGFADPNSCRVIWAYRSTSSTDGLDKVLLYDWLIDRWSAAALDLACIVAAARPGITLEGLDPLYPGGLETIPVSLDSFKESPFLSMAAIDSSNKLVLFNGPSLEAILDTAETNLGGATRMKVKGAAPIGDAAEIGFSLFKRDRLIDDRQQTDESAIGPTGYAPQKMANARFFTGRVRVAAGAEWSFMRGLDVDAVPAGTR